MKRLRVGISTCPNDTFAFHALIEGLIPTPGLELRIEFRDVQDLNERAAAGEFDLVKISYAAALGMAGDVIMLPSGSALGFGVGPVVLGAPQRALITPRVLCPGEQTTAHLLWRLFHDEPATVEQAVFSEIMPALRAGRADLGVCIHEGRFSYADWGLELIEDLGVRWEESTGAPLPLGGIAARRGLAPEAVALLGRALRQSIEWAQAHRDECLPTMRRHAQELDDEVLWKHVDLYVNDWTLDLGDRGRQAIAVLAQRARDVGLGRGEIEVAS